MYISRLPGDGKIEAGGRGPQGTWDCGLQMRNEVISSAPDRKELPTRTSGASLRPRGVLIPALTSGLLLPSPTQAHRAPLPHPSPQHPPNPRSACPWPGLRLMISGSGVVSRAVVVSVCVAKANLAWGRIQTTWGPLGSQWQGRRAFLGGPFVDETDDVGKMRDGYHALNPAWQT